MYTIREFAKKRINSGVFARFVFFLSGITELMKKTTQRYVIRQNDFLHFLCNPPQQNNFCRTKKRDRQRVKISFFKRLFFYVPLFCIEKDTRNGVLYAPSACVLVELLAGLEPATC